MVDISLDKSRAVRIKARTNESSVPQVFVFTNSDGSAHDISSYDFKLYLQKRSNSNVKLFTLSIGSGLTVQGSGSNELLIEVTAEQSTQTADTYFWRLFSVTEDNTWLNGPWEFVNGESDNEPNETPIVINPNGDSVTIEIASASGGFGSLLVSWDFSANAGEYPTDYSKLYRASDNSFLPVNTWFAYDGTTWFEI